MKNGTLRFTQAAAMNDPFEMYPCLSSFNESLKAIAYSQLETIKGTPKQQLIAKFMIPKMVKDGTAKFQLQPSLDYPMLCLTAKMNNLLMWSHYASAHHGFVLGFDFGHEFFHREKPRRMSDLRKVTYSKRRPILPEFEKCDEESVHETLFLNKSSHWAYEEEFRMFAKPEAAGQCGQRSERVQPLPLQVSSRLSQASHLWI